MELQLTKDSLKGKKLMVGTPMYGGQCYGVHAQSLLQLQYFCLQNEVDIKFVHLYNSSLIHTARNSIAKTFLESEFTHLLFVDADVSFDATDVLAMLALDKDVLGGVYPKKVFDWKIIKKLILNNPDIEPEEIEKIGGSFPAHTVVNKETDTFEIGELVELEGIGTGYMMIRKNVFETFIEKYPEYEYYNKDEDGIHKLYSFFNLEFVDTEYGKGALGEDYHFCYLLRKIGFKILLAPFISGTHSGTYEWKCNMVSVALAEQKK